MRNHPHVAVCRLDARLLLAAAAALACVFAASPARAVPSRLDIQGFLSDTAGHAASGEFTVLLSLYESRTAPTSFWDESATVVVDNGLFDAVLGADLGNPLAVSDFVTHDEVWLGVTVMAGPGVTPGQEPELPRKVLSAASYALVASHAVTADAATRATTAQSADTAQTAQSAAVATRANAVDCAGCVQISHLAFDPATQVELQAALAALDIPHAVDGMDGGTIHGRVVVTGAVQATGFELASGAAVCTSSGNCGANLGALSCVAPASVPRFVNGTWACVEVVAKATEAQDLACSGCVAESELAFDPVTAAELASALANYVASTTLASTLGDYVTRADFLLAASAYVTQLSLAATLAPYAKIDQLPTSIAGLGGGAIIGDVAASGAISGAVVRQNGRLVCDVSGNCGPTLASVQCNAGQVLQYVADAGGGHWGCANAALTTPPVCAGANKALQWSGSAWSCADLSTGVPNTTKTYGFSVVDSWGNTWDGRARPTASWAVASAQCVAVGARLPTMTEAYRVNRRYGTGEVADVNDNYDHWTLTRAKGTAYFALDFSDGSSTDVLTTAPYRCIWPNPARVAATFSAGSCNGPPGDECWHGSGPGDHQNIDKSDRPSLPWYAAIGECNFYHGRLARIAEYGVAIQKGLPNGSNAYLWSSDHLGTGTDALWGTDGFINTIKWTGAGPAWAVFYAGTRGSAPFRCVGLDSDVALNPNPTADAFTVAAAKLATTVTQSAAVSWTAALDACFAAGGHVPTPDQWMTLIRAGLPRIPPTTKLWANDAESTKEGIIVWSVAAADYTGQYVADPLMATRTDSLASRCVWQPVDAAYVAPAEASCNGGCFAIQQTTGAVTRRWWVDSTDRPAANITNALVTCYDLGAQLPVHAGLAELIRAGLPGGSGASLWTGDWNNVNGIAAVAWTGSQGASDPAPWDASAGTTTITSSTGAVTAPYRCVWSNEIAE